jgi:hypothetical protein
MRRADVGSGQSVPLRIEPDFGKGSEYVSQPPSSERCHVLHDEDSRSNHANELEPSPPEGGPLAVVDAGTLARERYVLTREATRPDGRLGDVLRLEGCDVVMALDSRPVSFEDGNGVWVALALEDGRPETSALEAEFQSTDPGEE